jgi:hypothetical protein
LPDLQFTDFSLRIRQGIKILIIKWRVTLKKFFCENFFQLLIPVGSVVRITKERTAKIIPNAVGICTRSEKHIFASLLSRDTTYKLMCKVWNYSIDQEAKEVLKITTVNPHILRFNNI